MKILQLVTKRQYRGAEVFAATLSDELIRKGISVVFAGLYSPPDSPLTVRGAVNIDLNGPKGFLSISLLKKVIALLREHQPDVIQANGSDTLKYAVAARLFTRRVPVIYRNISVVSMWVGRNRLKKVFYQQLFSRVDFVTSVGHESLNDLINFFGYPVHKTRVIRRGIPLTVIDREVARREVRNEVKLPATTRLVVHAGNYSKEKNHEFLLTVFQAIKQHDSSIKLLLLGEGETYGHIASEITRRELGDTVFQLGFQRNIAHYLAAAELFVLCSWVEGVPGVILEAGQQGVPSVSSDVGGVREVIESDTTGVLMSEFNPLHYAEVITSLLNDKKRLMDMGENARRFVMQNFNAERNAQIFIELYSDLINGKANE